MSAQLSPNIVLGYREQGSQQVGDSLVLSYDEVRTAARKTVADFGARWSASKPDQIEIQAVIPTATTADPETGVPWRTGQPRTARCAVHWVLSSYINTDRSAKWLQFATRLSVQPRVPWVLSNKQDDERASFWGKYAHRLALDRVTPWVLSRKRDVEQHDPWGQFAAKLARSAAAGWSKARSVDDERWNPWSKFSRTVNAPWVVVVEEGSDDTSALITILPARFYMTTHNVFAERLPDLAPVPLYDATVSADAGSYCWTLQLSGPASLFELLAPVAGLPAQIRVTMDGIPWVFAVDGMQRTSAFGKTGVSVTGRSVTALIGAPYLRAVTRDNVGADRLAQQLALDALEYSGVGLDWGLTDWLVPADAWSHNGPPLDAVQAIAQAAGGYLQSHRSAATLLTRHPYSQRAGDNPGAPWGWMTGPADVDLALDAIITDGVERRDGPDINAVYVSGTSQGVLARVKRTGTAGDKLSAMVTDALITHADAARQRGLAVLGAAGSKYNVRLELPVLTGPSQPGVLEVGQLVQVNAASPWRGRVRAVSAAYKRPTLRQTVTLERHLETV